MKGRLLVAAALLFVSPSAAFAQSSIPGYDELNTPCPQTPYCGSDCTNYPFRPTNCKTTSDGPARANIVVGFALSSTNMLYCPGGTKDAPKPYALCFFSGPTTATGTAGSVGTNQTLTCLPDAQSGIANCQCQVYNTGSYYVDINSILNLGVFYQTKQICGSDGSLCKNIAACDGFGNQKTDCGKSPCPTCTATVAPVCTYVATQPTNPDGGLYPTKYTAPSRVDLISTFSFAMGDTSSTGPYQLGSTPCTNGLYAGCMTAPCKYLEGGGKGDGAIVNCACPMWQGDYQIGQSGLPQSLVCPTNAGWVWSAANAVTH